MGNVGNVSNVLLKYQYPHAGASYISRLKLVLKKQRASRSVTNEAVNQGQQRHELKARASGDILDKITIITEGETNKVVTAYPSKD